MSLQQNKRDDSSLGLMTQQATDSCPNQQREPCILSCREGFNSKQEAIGCSHNTNASIALMGTFYKVHQYYSSQVSNLEKNGERFFFLNTMHRTFQNYETAHQ